MLQKAETEGTLTPEMQAQRAKRYVEKGELEKAVSAYKKALDMRPQGYEREELTATLLGVYAKLDRIDPAIELYEAELRANSSSTRQSTSYGLSSGITIRYAGDEAREALIRAYKAQDKLDALKIVFEARREKESDNPIVLEMIAEIYRNADEHAAAAETYQVLAKVQSEPKNIISTYYAAAALHQNEQPELAKAQIEQAETALASSNANRDESLLGALATICSKAKMYAPAMKLAKDAIIAAEDSGGSTWELEYLYPILGECALNAKQYEEAFNAYQQLANIAESQYRREDAETKMHQIAKQGNLYEKWIPQRLEQVQENPDNLDARFNLAEAYEFSDNVDEAIAEYQQLSERQPDNAEWHKKLGNLYQKQSPTGVQQAAAAYQKAIQLEPTTYESYRLLAEAYTKGEQPLAAEAVYRRALDVSFTQSEHEAALQAILNIYTDQKEQSAKYITLLEELKPKMQNSAVLHERLGDAYKKADDTGKAEAAYEQWFNIRQKEVNRRNSYWYYRRFAEELLTKNLYPETALEFAKRAALDGSGASYTMTLGQAHLANEQYEEALKQFKLSLNALTSEAHRDLFAPIAKIGKSVQNKERYIEMLQSLVTDMADNLQAHLNLSLVLAEFYRENGMLEEASASIQATGFITEDAWWTLGHFDNTGGIGYDTAYISEQTTQIDPKVKYEGRDGQIHWQKSTDDVLNAYISLGEDIDWGTAYAFATVTSPDERNVEFRFDCDDQGKVWLNGEEVFLKPTSYRPEIDRYIVPVTLKPGNNTILVKVCEDEGGWGFYLRITDTDGKPFDDLTINPIADKGGTQHD